MAVPRQPVKCREAAPPAADSENAPAPMPTLFRLITVTAILAALGYGAVWALANFLEPSPRTITITVPQDRFGK